MIVDHIKLSQQAKDQLIKLKRVTGIKNWNVLCRWAFCTSLAEPTKPTVTKIPADSSVEMTWKVFAGDHGDLYAALLYERCIVDGLPTDAESLALQLRLHLHRGISYLFADKKINSIVGLLQRSLPAAG
jgi:DNA sulfur modification protein DndE